MWTTITAQYKLLFLEHYWKHKAFYSVRGNTAIELNRHRLNLWGVNTGNILSCNAVFAGRKKLYFLATTDTNS